MSSLTSFGSSASSPADPDLARAECWYWIRKLQARFFAGDYASAIDAASRGADGCCGHRASTSKRRNITSTARCRHAAVCGPLLPMTSAGSTWRLWPPITGSSKSGRRIARRISRTAPRWSAPRSPASKAASSTPSVSTNRPSARPATTASSTTRRSPTNCAARFYAARGFEQIAQLYLRNARYGYLRWGADGKVRQLEQIYPHLREEERAPGPTSTIGAPVEHLDLATVIKVSQAVSGEIVLEKLIDTLMRTAIEQAGAERGSVDSCCKGTSSGSRRKPRPAAIR